MGRIWMPSDDAADLMPVWRSVDVAGAAGVSSVMATGVPTTKGYGTLRGEALRALPITGRQ